MLKFYCVYHYVLSYFVKDKKLNEMKIIIIIIIIFNSIQLNSLPMFVPPLSLFLLLSLPSPPYYIVTLSNGEREEKRDSMCTQSDALRPRACPAREMAATVLQAPTLLSFRAWSRFYK